MICRPTVLVIGCLIGLTGCAERALVVDPVHLNGAPIVGQTFCLPKAIVPVTVAKKPKTSGSSTGNQRPSNALGNVTFDDLSRAGSPSAAQAASANQATPRAGVGPQNETPPADQGPTQVTAAANDLSLSIGKVRFIPDCDFIYTVKLDHNVFFNDDVTISIDPVTRLLKSVNSELEDKTPEIVSKIAGAPAEILGAVNTALATGRTAVDKFEIKHDIDPTDPQSVHAFNRHLKGLSPTIRLVTRPLIKLPHNPRVKPGCGKDLCFRTAMPYVIEIKTTSPSANPRVIAQQIVVVANPYVVASIPVTRAPFVKREVNLTFANGMLVKTQIKNPSEVLGFIGIPIDVAKAIVSIPSAMLKFEVLQTSNSSALIEAQKQNLTLQRELIQAQGELLAAAQAPPQ